MEKADQVGEDGFTPAERQYFSSRGESSIPEPKAPAEPKAEPAERAQRAERPWQPSDDETPKDEPKAEPKEEPTAGADLAIVGSGFDLRPLTLFGGGRGGWLVLPLLFSLGRLRLGVPGGARVLGA